MIERDHQVYKLLERTHLDEIHIGLYVWHVNLTHMVTFANAVLNLVSMSFLKDVLVISII